MDIAYIKDTGHKIPSSVLENMIQTKAAHKDTYVLRCACGGGVQYVSGSSSAKRQRAHYKHMKGTKHPTCDEKDHSSSGDSATTKAPARSTIIQHEKALESLLSSAFRGLKWFANHSPDIISLAKVELRSRSKADDYGILTNPINSASPIKEDILHSVKMDVRFMVPDYLDITLSLAMTMTWDAMLKQRRRMSRVVTPQEGQAAIILMTQHATLARLDLESSPDVAQAAASMLVDGLLTYLQEYRTK